MARYLWEVNYTPTGMKGLMKSGGTNRREVVEKLVQNLNGKLESFYYCLGENDAIIIAELPSNTDVAAVAMTVGAVGAASIKTTVLMTCEEVDQATGKTIDYTPPGG